MTPSDLNFTNIQQV